MTIEPSDDTLSVRVGPIELPIAGYYPAILGFGARAVTLFLEPTMGTRMPRFELSINQPFELGTIHVDDPTRIGDHARTLLQHEIQRAVTIPGDGVEVEFVRGDRLVVDGTRWELRGSDGSHREPQPNGGIATWPGPGATRIGEIDLAGFDATNEGADVRPIRNRDDEVVLDIGAGIDLPGPGLVVDGIAFDRLGGVELQLTTAGDPAEAWEVLQQSMDAARFTADLRIDPAATPPDPELLDSMNAAVQAADISLSSSTAIRLWGGDPVASELGSQAAKLLGSSIESVQCRPGAILEVMTTDGLRITAPQWSIWRLGGPTWSGEDGRAVMRPEWRGVPLELSEIQVLAVAWLDHDRTGQGSRFWAWERVEDVVRHQPVTGWALARRLISGAADEQQLMSVAAGPLEDLLGAHSGAILDQVETAARSDPRVMRALGGVWQNAISDEDWLRIQAILGR